MAKKFRFLGWFFFIVLSIVSQLTYAEVDESVEAGPRRVFQLSYLNDVQKFKADLINRLEEVRSDLTQKKYPQAFFIKSLQGQIQEMNFQNANDFKNLEEQLFSLLQSVNSQSHANKSLAHVRFDSDSLFLGKLASLKKQFDGENQIQPSYIYQARDVDSEGFWNKAKGTIDQLSNKDQAVIFFTVLSGYLILFFNRKLQTAKPKKAATVSLNNTKTPVTKTTVSQEELATATLNLNSFDGAAICRVNSRDQIVYFNSSFTATFGKPKLWNKFFQEQFILDQKAKGTTNLYSLKKETDSCFMIQVSERDKSGLKTVFIWNLSWTSDKNNDAGTNVEMPATMTFNDLIEDSLVKFQGFAKRIRIQGADELKISEESLDDLTLKEMTETYIKLISHVSTFKNSVGEIVLKVDETETRCLMSCFLPGVQLRPEDLGHKLKVGNQTKTFNTLFKEIKMNYPAFEVDLKIKNIFNSKASGLYLDLSFNKEITIDATNVSAQRDLAV